jgi:uncharacterized protein
VSQSVDVVEQLVGRFRAGDWDAALDLLHPEFRIEQPASLPHGGWHRGRDGMGAMAGVFARYWDRTIGPPRIVDCGDLVVQITAQTWTGKATGRSATVDVVELFTVTDGLVREIRVFQQDTHLLLGLLDDAPPG